MTEKTLNTKKGNAQHRRLEEWIETGNRLHDRAIFDLFARLLSRSGKVTRLVDGRVAATRRCKSVTA